MANACGPCIGQWKRHTVVGNGRIQLLRLSTVILPSVRTAIPIRMRLLPRQELTMALTIAGDLCFNPLKDSLVNKDGVEVKLAEPSGEELPLKGFAPGDDGYIARVARGVKSL